MPTTAELRALRRKYGPDKIAKIRGLFDKDKAFWSSIKHERDLDLQCISTETDDPTKVAGPWPPAEWNARHAVGNERPCLHEDLLTPYCNQVINKIEMNPMGIEAKPAGQGSTEESADFVENRIRGLEYEENGTYAYNTAAKCAVEGSYGWWKFETKYGGYGLPAKNMGSNQLASAAYGGFIQRICIVAIADPNTILPSFFKKPDASDVRRCWELERMSHEEYRDKYPRARIRSFDGMDAQAPGWIDDNTVQVAAWWHLESDERELLQLDTGETGMIEVFSDDLEDINSVTPLVKNRRKVAVSKVVKTIFNGVEALDETEWIDPGTMIGNVQVEAPEIPIFGVFGRMKYQDGKLIIESLVRKGRVGQLLYDFTISSIQEETSQVPKAKAWGPEGVFDTSTPWKSITRTPIAYAEWKPAYDENGNLLPAPEFIPYTAQLQQLLLAKESIVIGIQNAIGMTGTERKDKAAKSGKALDALMEEMTTGTSHYFGALRMAQERSYRMLQRCLPEIESGNDHEVAVRDKFGKHEVVPMPENAYQGRYSITVGAGKMYQSLQAKQEDTATELITGIKDPGILLAVLPGAIRMKGLGEYGEQLAKMIETLQPPEMQQVREGGKQGQIDPAAQQAIQQAQQQLQALNEHAKQLEQQVIELQDKIAAQVVQSESKEKISAEDNATKLKIEQMRIDAQQSLKELELEIEKVRATIAERKTQMELGTKVGMQDAEHRHAETESERARIAAASEAEANRAHETATAKASED